MILDLAAMPPDRLRQALSATEQAEQAARNDRAVRQACREVAAELRAEIATRDDIAFTAWKQEASAYALREFCVPADGLDDWWLRPAFEGGETGPAAVDRFARRHGLTRRADWDIEAALSAMGRFSPATAESLRDNLRRAQLVR